MGGCSWYYLEGALKEVKEGGGIPDVGIPTPLEDEFEGATFSRFVVTEGNWYAEIQVQRLVVTAPLIGWAVVEEGPEGMKVTRMAIVDGAEARKLDITERVKKEPSEEGEKKEGEAEESGEKKEGEAK